MKACTSTITANGASVTGNYGAGGGGGKVVLTYTTLSDSITVGAIGGQGYNAGFPYPNS